MRIHYAIVFVSDMERSVAFYRDVLGLPMKFASSHWTEFATDGATLALHRSEVPTEVTGETKGEPPGRCRPGLRVPDLGEFHARMQTNKVLCLQEPKEVFGARIAQYVDPDGLVISVSEDRAAANQAGKDAE